MNNATSANQKSAIKNQKSAIPRRRMRRSNRVTADPTQFTPVSSPDQTLETSTAAPENQKSDHDSRSEQPVEGHKLVAGLGSQISDQQSAASSPNQKSDIINQKSPANQKSRARPFQPLPEFAALNPDQLEYIHDLLRTRTLAEAQQEIWAELHVRIHTSKLHRYKHKLDLADLLHVAEDSTTAIDELNNLFAGRATELSEAGLLVVQQRALALASSPTTSPSLLKNLFRIFTFEHRRAFDEQRLQIAAQREATRAQLAAHRIHIDNERLKLAQQKQAHHEQLHQPKSDWNQDEATQKVEAIMAYCRESLRREKERNQSLVPQADDALPSSSDDNQRSEMTAMNSETTQN